MTRSSPSRARRREGLETPSVPALALADGKKYPMRISVAPNAEGTCFGVVLQVGGFSTIPDAEAWATKLKTVMEREAGAVSAEAK